jgi:predicted PurR-regulated permease PerM
MALSDPPLTRESPPGHGRTAGGNTVPPPVSPRTSAAAGGDTVTLIERAIVLVLFAGLMLGVLLVLRPFATALLFGAILAIATWPLRAALVRAGLGRGLVSALLLLAALLLMGLPVLAVGPRLAAQLVEATHHAEAVLATLSAAPPDWLAHLPLVGQRLARGWSDAARAGGDLHIVLEPYADWIRQTVITAAQALADSVLQFVLALIVAAMFWANGDVLGATLRDVFLRLGGAPGAEALEAAAGSLRSVAYGVVGTAMLQGILMGLGAVIAGVPAPGLLGFVVMLLAISQIGAPLILLVWGGSAWWLLHEGAQGWAVFMLLWGLLLVSGSDNVVRPWLIKQGVAMPLTLVILGVFGGFLSFGFLGLFIGPALLAVVFTLLKAWRARALQSSG